MTVRDKIFAELSQQNGHLPHPAAILASEVTPERVTWLWPGRLALGKISMLDGNPGLGKSTLQLDIISRVTTGEPFPGMTGRRDPMGAVVLSAEDGVADTIVPRLIASGADLSRVLIVSGVLGIDGLEVGLSLPSHVPVIGEAIARVGAGLVVIDPLMAYFGAEINANKDQDVRRALAPLKDELERTHCAAWLVRHLTKGEAKDVIYRGGGSIGIIGAARFGSMVARDPDDGEARIMAPTKVNLGPEPPSLRYRLVGMPGSDVARVLWDGESAAWTAQELVEGASNEEEKEERDEATRWLSHFLRGGPQPTKVCWQESRKAGHGERAIRKAKKALDVQYGNKVVGADWDWSLPTNGVNTGSPEEPPPWNS